MNVSDIAHCSELPKLKRFVETAEILSMDEHSALILNLLTNMVQMQTELENALFRIKELESAEQYKKESERDRFW